MNLEAAIETNLIILDVAKEYTGSLYDSRVLRNSNIFRMAENGDDLSCPDDIIGNAGITLNLLSDGRYPLTKWLVTPYSISPNLATT